MPVRLRHGAHRSRLCNCSGRVSTRMHLHAHAALPCAPLRPRMPRVVPLADAAAARLSHVAPSSERRARHGGSKPRRVLEHGAAAARQEGQTMGIPDFLRWQLQGPILCVARHSIRHSILLGVAPFHCNIHMAYAVLLASFD